jgi:transposase
MLAGMKQYSVDLRERLLGAIDAGLSQAEAARLFGVGTATIERWRRRQRESGSVAPHVRSGRPRCIAPLQLAVLRAQVQDHPEATLAEHCARWEAARGGV